MARPPHSTPSRTPFDANVEETLRFDHARWSGFRDGLGERENGVDEQGFSIELLRLRKEFNPHALALTDRILRLIDFDRTCTTRALRVDQDENSPRLVLVSERAPGFRLSELLERGAERGVIADLGAALFVMRRLLAAAAAVHSETGVVHLAVAPERIVITPRGDAVVVEAAVAGALEAFGARLPAAVRKALRLARIDADPAGAHADIARIALAGMAMLVGRPLDPADEIDPLSPVVQEVVEIAALRGGDQFAAALTPWLDRAITIDPELSFADFREAADALDGLAPPAEARCSASRRTVRRFLKDLAVDETHRTHLEGLEGDRVREIRARQIRGVPVWHDAGGDADTAEDPAAAIMDMPIAVEELSTEILNHPLAVYDLPPIVVDEPAMDEATASTAELEYDVPAEQLLTESPFEFQVVEEPVALEEQIVEEPVAEELFVDDANARSTGDDTAIDEAVIGDEPLPDYAAVESLDPLDYGVTPEEIIPSTDPSLDALVDEILRRGVEPVLPEYSETDELFTGLPSGVDIEAAQEPEAFGEAPVEEPEREPPVDEPPQEEPPAEEPPPYEPPVDEPPPHEAPIEEPPEEAPPVQEPDLRAGGEESVEEQSPLWMRAAIEQVARSRQERPAAAPTRQEPRAPVFELPDEPEPEKEAETTTLSDIAKEMGITIEPPQDAPAERSWQEENEEEGWDDDIRRVLLPPIEAVPPPVAHTTFPHDVPAPPAAIDPPSPARLLVDDRPAPIDSEPIQPETIPRPVEPPPPVPSFADRMPDLQESGGRFLRIAATLLFVVAALGAAGYGGWRYYGSISAPGTLVVETTPPGSEVTIDGAARGSTPLTVELAPGSHAVEVTRGGVTRRFNVEVRPGEAASQTLDWSSVRPTGSLAVTTNPAGAKVTVNGKEYGVTPVTVPSLAVGRHTVVLESSGGTIRRQVNVQADATATLDEAIFSGWIAVFAPVELQILEGGRVLGTSENGRIMVPAGRYDLTLVNKELGARLARSVEVEPGQVAAINITEVPTAAPPSPQP